MDWYEEYIEPEIRELVKYLRNNGINTECSCGHEGYIQCWHNIDGSIKELHDLLYVYFAENGPKKSGREYSDDINYEIEVRLTVRDGHVQSTLNIKLLEGWRNKGGENKRIAVHLRLWKGVWEAIINEPPNFKENGWIKLELEKIPESLKVNGVSWDRKSVKEKLEEECTEEK